MTELTDTREAILGFLALIAIFFLFAFVGTCDYQCAQREASYLASQGVAVDG